MSKLEGGLEIEAMFGLVACELLRRLTWKLDFFRFINSIKIYLEMTTTFSPEMLLTFILLIGLQVKALMYQETETTEYF